MSSTSFTGTAPLSRTIPFPDVSIRRSSEHNIQRFEAVAGAVERVSDFCAVLVGWWLAYEIQKVLMGPSAYGVRSDTSIAALIGFALLMVLLLENNGDYRGCVSLLAVRETERVLRSTLAGFSLVLPIVAIILKRVPLMFCGLAILTVPLALGVEKWQIQNLLRVLREKLHVTRRAVIVGTGAAGRRIFSALVRSPNKGFNPVAVIEAKGKSAEALIHEAWYQHTRNARVISGPVTSKLLRQLNAEVLILADSSIGREQVAAMRVAAQAAEVTTYTTCEPRSDCNEVSEYLELDGMMLSYRTKGAERRLYEAGKRGLDVAFAALSLLFAAPVLAAAAIAVKLTSSGPVIFRQERVGRDGRLFKMYKFRTMHADSERYAPSPVSGRDPRITPMGRILRHTCIDELPQLLNVLKGDMSLVGPRPEMPFLVEKYEELHLKRLTVKPGITGLWQLSADRLSPIHENISYDFYYLRHNPRFLWELSKQAIR